MNKSKIIFSFDIVYKNIIRKIMIEEFLRESGFTSKDKIVILGEPSKTDQLYRNLENLGIKVKRSTDIKKFEETLQKYQKKIIEKEYIFILTDKKYLRWMEVLDNNEIPCKQYVVIPLYLVEKIKE